MLQSLPFMSRIAENISIEWRGVWKLWFLITVIERFRSEVFSFLKNSDLPAPESASHQFASLQPVPVPELASFQPPKIQRKDPKSPLWGTRLASKMPPTRKRGSWQCRSSSHPYHQAKTHTANCQPASSMPDPALHPPSAKLSRKKRDSCRCRAF